MAETPRGLRPDVLQRRAPVPVYVVVFTVMTAVWCVAGYFLVTNPIFGRYLGRYGRIALPFVFIALGGWILAGARML